MSHVLNQRRVVLGIVVALAIFAHGLVVQTVLPSLPGLPGWGELVKFVLAGGVIYSGIVLVPLWFYDKCVWRLLNPQYDVSGTWTVELYDLCPVDEKHVSVAGRKAITPYQSELTQHTGQAMIRQTPFRVWVQEATGFSQVTPKAGITTWTAEVVAERLPGRMRVVFESAGSSGLSGRDDLTISNRNWRGRPSAMEGDAFHVLKHLDIVIKGAIRYTRVTRRPNNRMQPTPRSGAADA